MPAADLPSDALLRTDVTDLRPPPNPSEQFRGIAAAMTHSYAGDASLSKPMRRRPKSRRRSHNLSHYFVADAEVVADLDVSPAAFFGVESKSDTSKRKPSSTPFKAWLAS
jgi:hypothetical protein